MSELNVFFKVDSIRMFLKNLDDPVMSDNFRKNCEILSQNDTLFALHVYRTLSDVN